MNASQLLKQANQLKREGRLEEAIALYHQVIQINPNFAWAYNNLGDAFVKQGKFDEAVIEYRRSIKINPNTAWFYINLGQLLIQQDYLDEAINYFMQAIQIKYDLPQELNDKHEKFTSNLLALTADSELLTSNVNFPEPTQTEQFSDLDSLAKLTPETLQNHPNRDKLAVFVAFTHLLQGDTQAARHLIRLALDWNLSKRYVSQILISSLHRWLGGAVTFAGVRHSWYIGDWEALAQLDKASLFHHPERAKLALLAAAGHQQLGDMNATRRCTNLALEWGCSHNFVCRVLASGIYNLLGRGAVVAHRYELSLKQFKSALAVMEIEDSPQNTLLKSRVKQQIRQIRSLDTQKVIKLVLNSDS